MERKRYIERERERERDRDTNKQKDKEREREREGETERGRERERESEREREGGQCASSADKRGSIRTSTRPIASERGTIKGVSRTLTSILTP